MAGRNRLHRTPRDNSARHRRSLRGRLAHVAGASRPEHDGTLALRPHAICSGLQDIKRFPAVIGRGRDADVMLADFSEEPKLSRHHIRLNLEGGHVLVEDLSSNGTHVGERLLGRGQPIAVPEDTPVWLGPSTMVTFRILANEAPPNKRVVVPGQGPAAAPTPPAEYSMELRLLGSNQVLVGDTVLDEPVWQSRKALVLLACLSAQGGSAVMADRGPCGPGRVPAGRRTA
ncbi:MAG: FHA domain-containing protein [Candidatus Xenobia bacterium]